MPWIPPELREDRGEIRAALAGKLPELIEVKDILAELHCHSTWSDGRLSILEMARAAMERGRKVLAITDHSPSLVVTGGRLTAEEIPAQRAEIEAAQRELGDSILLLQGSEVEIRADGSLDYPDEVLASLDIVFASLHVSLRQPREQITERLLSAIRNPHVDVIGHPMGRLIPTRRAIWIWNGFKPQRRVGLPGINATTHSTWTMSMPARRRARHPLQYQHRRPRRFDGLDLYGIETARQGWVEAKDMINTWAGKAAHLAAEKGRQQGNDGRF
jgi:DNA polymerase (family 10)